MANANEDLYLDIAKGEADASHDVSTIEDLEQTRADQSVPYMNNDQERLMPGHGQESSNNFMAIE